jgi:hypothetical protein
MLIAGVSTLVFNGNPLLRFDGYYVLADLIAIPNLDTRAKRYLIYLFQRYALGLDSAESPVQGPGERGWFVFYGIAAFVYRVFVMVGISLFIATKFAVAGVLLALWTIGQMNLPRLAICADKPTARDPALARADHQRRERGDCPRTAVWPATSLRDRRRRGRMGAG